MINPIIPKVAYVSLEYTLSVDEFLEMWEQFRLQETEGNPTQKCLSTAKEYFYDMRGEIEGSVRLREDN